MVIYDIVGVKTSANTRPLLTVSISFSINPSFLLTPPLFFFLAFHAFCYVCDYGSLTLTHPSSRTNKQKKGKR